MGVGASQDRQSIFKPDNNPMIVLTVPHAVCLSRVRRDCDRLAEKAARQLWTLLEPITPVTLIVGDVYRAKGDLNRQVTRLTTNFRKQLRKN
jgi:hypothetical protein